MVLLPTSLPISWPSAGHPLADAPVDESAPDRPAKDGPVRLRPSYFIQRRSESQARPKIDA